MPNSVAAIMVTYGATLSEVEALVRLIKGQVTQVILVDNGSPSLKKLKSHAHLHIIRLNKNYGIAYAQNIGIERAIKLEVDCVLFLDQDSAPYPGMVGQLQRHHIQVINLSIPLAGIGPVTIDRRIGIRSSFVVKRLGLPSRYREALKNKTDIIEAHFLISSGSLISLRVLKTIGGLRSDYFIDHVDTEWCLRAQSQGFVLMGALNCLMDHALGDSIHRVWFLGWRSVSWHLPYRDYYVYRNTLLTVRDVKLSFIWHVFLLWRLVKFFVYFIATDSERLQRLKYIYLGLRDGLLNRRGRLDLKTLKLHPIPKTSLDI